MFVITFSVEGIPVAKGRPRFKRVGNFVQTYTPNKTATWEEIVRQAAKNAMGTTDLLETPVTMALYFRLPMPQSWSKKRKEGALKGLEAPTKKPDWDNLGKAVSDALNGVIFKDDSQIVSAHVRKIYSAVPGVDIYVSEDLL
jgi:Holliday junction resolvase RusA-like endonuclease